MRVEIKSFIWVALLLSMLSHSPVFSETHHSNSHIISVTEKDHHLIAQEVAEEIAPVVPSNSTAPVTTSGGRNVTSEQPSAQKGKVVKKGETPETKPVEVFNEYERPSLVMQASVIVLMALLPFIVMLLTPFLKIVVVLSLLRTALGVQNSPPNAIINGIAVMIALFVMYPTAAKMYEIASPTIKAAHMPDSLVSRESAGYIIGIVMVVREPMRDFLQKNSEIEHQRIFYRMVYKALPDNLKDTITPSDFVVLVPAFIVGQLKQAFEIGVMIYIPFFVIDLVVSNILLAMGMMMLSPVTISMPLKLFLLVMLDGWTVLIQGLTQTFK